MPRAHTKLPVSEAHGDRPAQRRFAKIALSVLLPLAVLVGGVGLGIVLIKTGPQAQRKTPVRRAQRVAVQTIQFSRQPTLVEAMGTVRPAREITLHPRVSGQVIQISDEFMPGGNFVAGQMLLHIDPTDYRLAVRQRQSDVARTRSAYRLELGQQRVAQREYELLGEPIPEATQDLVLRQPQLESAKAAFDAAEATLERAQLDLARTQITAPFNALLKSRTINIGTQVNTSTPLGTLVGTDTYWIEVSVPVDQLKWLQIPRSAAEEGAKARVYNEAAWGPDSYRNGTALRLEAEVEREGRLARLILAVEDPLALQPKQAGAPAMLLGTYVRVEIEGRYLDEVAVVERNLLRDGDQVWLMNAEDQLEIRPVEVVFQGRNKVFVKRGLNNGDRLVTTDLSAPVQGMPLLLQSDKPSAEFPLDRPSEKGQDL